MRQGSSAQKKGPSIATGRGGDYFTTTGRDLAGDSLVIGTTLKARVSETVFAQPGYDCTLQSDNGATDHALSLQQGWRF
jgi:hypothetical protein